MKTTLPQRETEYKVDVDEQGNVVTKSITKIKAGKKSKQQGLLFELKVRKDLEAKGWIVDKWSNNVDLEKDGLIAAKKNWKFNPFRKIMMPSAQGTGFPDFVAFQLMNENYYKIIGVEVKSNGKLSKIEKDKCKWYLEKKIFSDIWIAKKTLKDKKLSFDYKNFIQTNE